MTIAGLNPFALSSNYQAGLAQQSSSKSAAKVTALALATIALVLLTISCALWGLGTSPGMMLTGMSFFPYLIGSVLGSITIGVTIGASLFTVKMLFHGVQEWRYNRAIDLNAS